MPAITLNPVDQRVVQYMARCRYAYCRQVGAGATRYDDTAVIRAEIDSLGAEFAYCRLMNVYPDTNIDRFLPYDARLANGLTVDVKQTARENGRLLVKEKDRKELPDLYALMVGQFPTYRLAGHVRAGEILRAECLDRSLPHPAYSKNQAELTPGPNKD